MARKRFSDEDVIRLLRQIEVELASGATVATACRSAGVSDATYYGWRKKFGGMGPSFDAAHLFTSRLNVPEFDPLSNSSASSVGKYSLRPSEKREERKSISLPGNSLRRSPNILASIRMGVLDKSVIFVPCNFIKFK